MPNDQPVQNGTDEAEIAKAVAAARRAFDRLPLAALTDPECPAVSTVIWQFLRALPPGLRHTHDMAKLIEDGHGTHT